MLVEIYEKGSPQWTLDHEPGTPTMVSGLAARVTVQTTHQGACGGMGADSARTEFIALPTAANYVEIDICSRGLNSGQYAAATRMLASIRVTPLG